jgi:hypothetical protein
MLDFSYHRRTRLHFVVPQWMKHAVDAGVEKFANKATRGGPIGAYKQLDAADVEAILRASL